MGPATPEEARDVLVGACEQLGVPFEEISGAPGDGPTVVVELPGEHKLKIATSFAFGRYSVAVNAFVVRAPQERVGEIHRWLLRRNQRLFAVAYAIDHLGDIYLVGRMPLGAVSPQTVDELLGVITTTADGDFDTLLQMGFETAIRDEWRWRLSRGESTRNLEAFRHLAPTPDDAAGFGHDR